MRVFIYFWVWFSIRCEPKALEDALCKRVMVTPEEVIQRTLDPLSAVVSRDGLAKTIYSRLFDWWDDIIIIIVPGSLLWLYFWLEYTPIPREITLETKAYDC